MIKANDITKRFGDVEVLKGVSLHIPQGKLVTIVGASGAGKTTLLQILGTLLPPSSGNVYINGQEVSRLNDKALSKYRNQHIGFVFQQHYLLPEFTALENVCIPAYIGHMSRKAAEDKARKLLKMLNLGHRMEHKPQALSGGEQQRVAIARALINTPDVVFADEPSGNLDTKNKEELHQLFFQLRDQLQQTFVIVTHDPQLAKQSDISYNIQDGKLAS